ncbi:MAG: hypothetical protein AB9919_12060 [Geobacteraceae bacterium]
MRVIITMVLLPLCLTLFGGSAFADTIQIKYRSGKVQTFRLDEPSSSIAGISYQEDSASSAAPAAIDPVKSDVKESAHEAAALPQKSSDKPKNDSKPPVRFEWAQPLE